MTNDRQSPGSSPGNPSLSPPGELKREDSTLKLPGSATGASVSPSAEYFFDEQLFSGAFKLFDEKRIGRIYKSDLIKVLRAAGHNPSVREMEEIFLKFNIREGDMVPLDKAISIGKNRPTDNVDKIIDAFRKFDRDSSGYISTEDMRTMLTSVGEKLTSQEVDELIEFADQNKEGKVDYEEFARLIAPKPLSLLKTGQAVKASEK